MSLAERDLKVLWHPYTQMKTMAPPVVITKGEGVWLYDEEGNKYLDGISGLFCTNLGHGRTDLTAAAAKQMDTLAFYPTWGFANEPATQAATMIAASVTSGRRYPQSIRVSVTF